MDAIVGSVWCFGFNFAPYGWAECNGQLLAIAQYQALYSLIGTTYGGNGQTTFGLPNMQGRVPIGTGQGLGLPNYVIGQAAGNESVTLTTANMPAHIHPVLTAQIPVNDGDGSQNTPAGNYFGMSDGSGVGNTYETTSNVTLAGPVTTNSGIAGSSFPISVLSPFLVVNYCISLLGIYPQRN